MNTDSVFPTGVIDVHEHRAVSMLDIKNDSLHKENEKYVLMLLRGNLEELLVNLDPKLYIKDVITSSQGVPMLYIKLIKYFYGMLCSAMMFYKNLRIHLEEIDFEINPYDPCMANMTKKSSRMTVCWYVDDIEVSQKDESAIYLFVLNIFKIFVNVTKVNRGKVLEYMVIDVDWYQDRTIIVSMIKYLQKIFDFS